MQDNKMNSNIKKVNITQKRLGLHEIIKPYRKKISISSTKFYKGAVRSGQRIEHVGSIVVIGDVNDGAELIAGENSVVVGTLRGLAHAGAEGNKDATIAASSIESSQIRIANIIKEMNREELATQEKKGFAYLGIDNKIFME